MRTFLKLFLVLTFILALASSYPAFAGEIVDGVSDTPLPEAQPGFIDFDPPPLFIQTLPLLVYMNTTTGALFLAGNGAVLNELGGFGVTGQSSPNFLAWNSGATNYDGSVPALPEVIAFTKLVSSVSMKVGSATSTGLTAVLVALNSSFGVVGVDSVTISSAMQTLSVSGSNIAYAVLVGPSVLVADDLVFN
jgi:hypothetical protein